MYPCTWIYGTEPEITITRAEICGPNNDTFEITVEPGIVTFTVGEWQDGTTTISIDRGRSSLYEWYNAYRTIEFTDPDDPCLESITLDTEAGAFVDVVPIYQIPMSASVTLHNTHHYEAIHITLPDTPLGIQQYILDVEADAGGPYTLNIDYPGTPFGQESATCVNGEIDIEILARPYSRSDEQVIPGEVTSTIATFPCAFLIQSSPITDIKQITVCGPNNDSFEIASQPKGVEYIIHDWVDGSTIIEFQPAAGYHFWNVGETAFPFSDIGTPCPTDAPVPPVQAEVCGPNNDEIVIPPQPEGVTLDDDSGWIDGIRTITFTVDPGFITDGETEFSFTDESIACEEDPVVATLIVTFDTSDGGSLEGAPYSFYAPAASQVAQQPYLEGEIGPGNQIVIEDLIAGTYRIVVDAEGYERIDELIEVAADSASEEHVIIATSLQPVETPTPTPSPTPDATPPPSPSATDEPAPVSGLPSTGSGQAMASVSWRWPDCSPR